MNPDAVPQGENGTVSEFYGRKDEMVILRSLAHAAFQRQGLTGHKLEIGACQLDADAADRGLGVAVALHSLFPPVQ